MHVHLMRLQVHMHRQVRACTHLHMHAQVCVHLPAGMYLRMHTLLNRWAGRSACHAGCSCDTQALCGLFLTPVAVHRLTS